MAVLSPSATAFANLESSQLNNHVNLSPIPAPGATFKVDLIANVLGIQIDIHAPTVEWSSGQCTVLPFLPKLPCSHHILNALESDTQFAEDLAKLPEAGLSSLLIVYLDKSTPKNALFKATYQALSLNKTLLIPTVFSLLWKV